MQTQPRAVRVSARSVILANVPAGAGLRSFVCETRLDSRND
ncbi:hypothetical protein SBA4_710032 [Candidatus Sulfopaludibacter sp. SbA4]|nr:hypothetical protein SBA4_710032 [Candidatus Sulfopaludibacter sp. SbA4]